MHNFKGLYIGGQWVPTDRTFDDMNPSNGEVWGKAPDAGVAETRAAIQAAAAAQPAWAALPHTVRARYMNKVADLFEKRRDDIVKASRGEGGGSEPRTL